ncbi:TlpA disulfide reductase family protein [Telluribacter sp. SYSU D00476]|uniref:TlpA family protein disulfide reductase n=1 Tax=Telluribacter sp. SYSU D00476 TaxID=2811430 RepID=UPI001FF13779|nr:TlpA disulfide reductase family protein [Telluribacter sp. SYSU D00476]
MRPHLLVLYTLIFCIANKGFTQKPTTQVVINCKTCVGQKASVSVEDLFTGGTSKLAEAVINPSGLATLNIPLTDTLLTIAKIGPGEMGQDSVYTLFLVPDQTLKLTMTGSETLFEGELSVMNQYLYQSHMVAGKVLDKASAVVSQFRNMSKEEQKKFKATFGAEFSPLHQAIRNDKLVPAPLKEFIIDNNTFLVQWRRSWLGGLDHDAIEKESGYNAPAFLQNLPIKASYLKANMGMYRSVIDYEIITNLHGSLYFALKKDGQEKNTDSLIYLTEKAIKSNRRIAPIREFVQAYNFVKLLSDYGLRPSVAQLYANFREEYPNSPYLSNLAPIVERYNDLAEGKPAKDFVATDKHGNEVRLSDFKGKIVYLDTWATWCVPCLAEFPNSKKMIEHYQGNEEVVFLFVSTDKDTEKWKTFLKSDKAPGGFHVNQNSQEEEGGIYSLYRMSGIPHYILIDQQGKIKANHAPRPSDMEIYGLIDGLLAK